MEGDGGMRKYSEREWAGAAGYLYFCVLPIINTYTNCTTYNYIFKARC